MKVREAFRLRPFSIGRMSVALYDVAVIAFIQGACAALIFFASGEHSSGSATLFRVVSVAFLIAGLTLIGATTVDARAAFPTRCLIALCMSLSVSILVFAVKGAFLAFVGSNINRYGSLVSTTYRWRDLALNIPVYFMVIFVVAEGRRLWSRSHKTRKWVTECPMPTDTKMHSTRQP